MYMTIEALQEEGRHYTSLEIEQKEGMNLNDYCK